jgi:hypothetical protein
MVAAGVGGIVAGVGGIVAAGVGGIVATGVGGIVAAGSGAGGGEASAGTGVAASGAGVAAAAGWLAAGSAIRRGLKRIFGASDAPAADAGAASAFGASGAGAEAGAAGAAGAASPSADFKRGFRRSAGGGGACSSLMHPRAKPVFRRRETKKICRAGRSATHDRFHEFFPSGAARPKAWAAGKKETKKIRSRSTRAGTTFLPPMTQRLLLSCIAAALLTTTGCSLFSKKSDKAPKDNGAISSEVEESLRRRWVEKRTSELVAAGVTADAARNQAAQEFRDKFEYTKAGKK